MTTPVPFVPTPRLDYTERYNSYKDLLRLRNLEDKKKIEYAEDKKLEAHQEEARIIENRKRVEELRELQLYGHLSQVNAYRDYKYAYWVGTLVDQYI
jgi:hypothetical protein